MSFIAIQNTYLDLRELTDSYIEFIVRLVLVIRLLTSDNKSRILRRQR